LIEVSPDSPLMLSIAYPPGTSFTITANAAWCSPSQYHSCKETFSAVSSIDKVRNSLGNTYHVDSNGLLTVRIIQTPQSFVGNPDWLLPDYSTPGKWGSWYALDRFSRNGVFLPRMSYGPWLDILANCQRSGAYCAKKPNDMSIDVCPQGYNQVAYDKCCNPSTCLYADGTTEPVTSPTISPTPMPTNSPTIFNKSPTYSPTPQPAECVDEPNDKFFLKTKGKNKKPVYQKCKWLAKKPAKKIKKICKKSKSYDGTGPAKEVCKELCGTCPTVTN